MADLYLKALHHWFDSNEGFLAHSGVGVPVLHGTQEPGNSFAHAEIETEHYLGEVTLWEYEDGHALVDTDFVDRTTEEFHPGHYGLYDPQELDGLLSNFVLGCLRNER